MTDFKICNKYWLIPERREEMSEDKKNRRKSTILDKLAADAAEKSNRKAIQDAKDREFLEQLREIEVKCTFFLIALLGSI